MIKGSFLKHPVHHWDYIHKFMEAIVVAISQTVNSGDEI